MIKNTNLSIPIAFGTNQLMSFNLAMPPLQVPFRGFRGKIFKSLNPDSFRDKFLKLELKKVTTQHLFLCILQLL